MYLKVYSCLVGVYSGNGIGEGAKEYLVKNARELGSEFFKGKERDEGRW